MTTSHNNLRSIFRKMSRTILAGDMFYSAKRKLCISINVILLLYASLEQCFSEFSACTNLSIYSDKSKHPCFSSTTSGKQGIGQKSVRSCILNTNEGSRKYSSKHALVRLSYLTAHIAQLCCIVCDVDLIFSSKELP